MRKRSMRPHRARLALLPACWLLSGMAGTAALAAPRPAPVESSSCDRLRPEQRLSEDAQKELDAAISVGIKGLASAGGSTGSASASSVQIQVLQQDALAKGWFIYQTCVMKEADLIDEATATELVRSLMGLEPVGGTTAVPAPAPVATPSAPQPSGSGTSAGPSLNISGPDTRVELVVDGSSLGSLGSGLRVPVEPGDHTLVASLHRYRDLEAVVTVPASGLDYSVPELTRKPRTGLYVGLTSLGVAVLGGAGVGIAAAAGAFSTSSTYGSYSSTCTTTTTTTSSGYYYVPPSCTGPYYYYYRDRR
jgi:hypothetical protein